LGALNRGFVYSLLAALSCSNPLAPYLDSQSKAKDQRVQDQLQEQPGQHDYLQH